MSDRRHEVEPLSEAGWSRVERAIFERLAAAQLSPLADELNRARQRRRRLFAVGGALVAAAALVLVATNLIGRGPRGESSRIVTAGAGSHVSYGEAALDVDPQSAVLVSGNDTAGVEVVLDRGGVTCEVAPRHGRPPFTVRAGAVRVRVIGTRFSVVREGDSGRVSVVHGTVEVTVNGQVSLVHAGERWPQIVTGGVPAAHPPVASPPVAVAAHPAPAVAHPAPRAAHAPHAPARAVPAPHVAPAPAVAPSAAPAPLSPPPELRPTPAQRFESAARLESRDPDAAASAYTQLAGESGPWAANALYAGGRLAADRGRRAEAKRLLDSYLARYPRGANAEDARQLLLRMK